MSQRTTNQNMATFSLFVGVSATLFSVLDNVLGSQVVSLTDLNFEDRIFSGTSHFVLFYAPW